MHRWANHAYADYVFENHGSVWLLRPTTPAAREYLIEHTPDATWFGNACAVEHRFVRDLAEGLAFEGFNVVRTV